MKIMITGHAGHGKDTFCEMLGLNFVSSSWAALEMVIWPQLGECYESKEDCFEDRKNFRAMWHRLITEYNTPDLTRLTKEIFKVNDIYCGIRNDVEFFAAKDEGLFDLSIWIDASNRLPAEPYASNKMKSEYCDFVVDNNGTISELQAKATTIKKALLKKESHKQSIIDWANRIFPDRTIENAIRKMVEEEIPEYLENKYDAMELADLGILLYDIANLAGVDLDDAIGKKMHINRMRSWAIDPESGLLKHIRG